MLQLSALIKECLKKKILTLLHMSIGELWMLLGMGSGLCVAVWALAYKGEEEAGFKDNGNP